jgi:hypothetical protein
MAGKRHANMRSIRWLAIRAKGEGGVVYCLLKGQGLAVVQLDRK